MIKRKTLDISAYTVKKSSKDEAGKYTWKELIGKTIVFTTGSSSPHSSTQNPILEDKVVELTLYNDNIVVKFQDNGWVRAEGWNPIEIIIIYDDSIPEPEKCVPKESQPLDSYNDWVNKQRELQEAEQKRRQVVPWPKDTAWPDPPYPYNTYPWWGITYTGDKNSQY